MCVNSQKSCLATKPCVKFYTVCEAVFCVTIGKIHIYTTSGYDGCDKYEVFEQSTQPFPDKSSFIILSIMGRLLADFILGICWLVSLIFVNNFKRCLEI